MAYTVQFRRGTTAEHSTFTGEKGELTFDTTTNRLVVHDGTTAYITEYAMVYTGSDLIGDASVTMSGNSVLLQYTPTSGSATVKVIATYMDV